MAAVKILYKNRGLDATWSATTSVATLPAANLADASRGKKYRGTSLTSQRVVADLGAAYAVGGVAVATHNLTSAASVVVKWNSSDSWASPAGTATLTAWDDKDSNVLVKLLDAAQTYRYWAFEPADPTNTDGYFEFGTIVISPVYAFADTPAELSLEFVDPSVTSYAPSGTPRTEDRDLAVRLSLDWSPMTAAAVFGDLQTMVREIGRKRDGVLSVYSAAPSADDAAKTLNLYGRFEELPPLTLVKTGTGDRYEWDGVVFRESL